MLKTYTDYINRIAISIPDKFIDVKTGETHSVSHKLQEQIEYHANNSTLIHLVFSALNQYLKPKAANGTTEEILHELSEIKRMIEHGCIPMNHSPHSIVSNHKNKTSKSVDLKEVEDVLEAFGG